MFDAIATVKNNKLLFVRAGTATTASGASLAPVTLTRADGDSHSFSIADREAYTSVRASYNDLGKAKKGEVVWGQAEEGAAAAKLEHFRLNHRRYLI